MPRDAFEGYDEPVNIDMEPEEALKMILDAAPKAEGLGPAEEDQALH